MTMCRPLGGPRDSVSDLTAEAAALVRFGRFVHFFLPCKYFLNFLLVKNYGEIL